ncbi:hypothetical protein FHS18_002122 [Paenibacillus phyllosphaerae]|uniref:Uncharacterized protein n=1 Tax=Paenibacillus phyllosphaerae TaxID=274593 RepID=A0A7W5AWG0_9BACL|nr:hypothetical protein [Paenibacillus phyllosphaerae]MBB3110055.1 hypothetical protein [Paenibacillus phyllosphaerae]
MAIFLDSKTSQNASYANSIAIPINAINAPELVAQQTLNLSGGTAGLTRVSFSGTIALQLGLLPVLTNVTLSVYRGLDTSGVSVFTASENLNVNLLGPQIISFSGSDFNAPNIANQAYTVFVTVSALGTVRVGPESFNFIAVSEV